MSYLDEKFCKVFLVYINSVWVVVFSFLYDGFYFNDVEIGCGKVWIVEYFVYSDFCCWVVGGNEIIEWIGLVCWWILKCKEKGEKVYVIIFSIYFDICIEYGF